MTPSQALMTRSEGKCELCASDVELSSFDLPDSDDHDDCEIVLCATCRAQMDQTDNLDANHWRCLNSSMWSTIPAVQVLAWRMLKRLEGESWAQELLEMLYLDETMQKWAEAGISEANDNPPTKDSNGATLMAGDSVTIIKDLDVKGAGFTAKRGTPVRNISLTDNPEHIEGRVNGTRIVILSCYVKKNS